jgi:hypothetical protein
MNRKTLDKLRTVLEGMKGVPQRGAMLRAWLSV